MLMTSDDSWKDFDGEKIYIIDDLNTIYPCCFSSLKDAKAYAIKIMTKKDPDYDGYMEWHDNEIEQVYIYGRATYDYFDYELVRVSMLYLNPSAA